MSDDKESLINIGLVPKELITNLLGPATKSIGEGLGGITNFVMGPLRKLNVVSEKSYQDFVEKINSKTDDIPIENRDASKLGLALKAMEDARYQLEEEEMREYFANLLAGLVDNRINQNASPRFSTILSELTTDEANMLAKLHKLHATPTVTLRVQRPNGDGIDVMQNTLLFDENDFLGSNSVLETLQSYGLIEIRSSIQLKDEKRVKIYDTYENSTHFTALKEKFKERYGTQPFFRNTDFEVSTIRGSVIVTNLGFIFCSMIFPSEEE